MVNLKKCLPFLILIIFLITPCVTAQDGEIHETFDTPDLPGWELGSHVAIGDGLLRIPPPEYAFKFGKFADLNLAFQVRLLGEGEFVLGYQASDMGMHQIVINFDAVSFVREQGETPRELYSQPHGIVLGDWMFIELHVLGQEHYLTIDEQDFPVVIDPDPLPPGGILLHARGDTTAEIDNFFMSSGNLPVADEPPPSAQPPAEVGEHIWVRTGGPLGGLGYDIRMHPENPDRMYVTDSWAGVFRSMDGGQTWFPSNNGIDARSGSTGDAIPIFCLTIDPHNPDIIWVGTQFSRGIFKSVDGGANWIRLDNGIVEYDGISFRGITVDPHDSNTVYAAAELSSFAWSETEVVGREFDMTKGVVYRTTDGGQNWTAIWRGDNLARYVLINPENTDIIYISTGIFDREAGNSDPINRIAGGAGVVKSTDGGQTWTNMNNGLNNLYVGSLFMHPENPDILLAGTGNNQYYDDSGVYITTNGGQSWQHVLTDINIESVEFALDNPQIAYAGGDAKIFRSEDGGFTWTATSSEDGWGSPHVRAGFPIDFQIDPRDSDRIFANNYGGGNFLSEDGGQTWIVASTGYTGAQVRDIAVDPTSPNRVYAAARSGLFRTDDSGQTWQGLNHKGFTYVLEWYVVAIDPSDAQHILASNNWTGILLESHDAGNSWQTVGDYLGDGRAWRVIAFAPTDSSIVYAGASAFYSAGTLAEDLPSSGVYVSHDSGNSWEAINVGLMQDANVTAIAIHPFGYDSVYVATGNHGLLRTRDGGVIWEAVNFGLNTSNMVLSVAIHPTQSDIVFAGLQRSGIVRSQDAGATWDIVGVGLPPESTISDIVFDPTNPMVMYIADRQSGVYRSTDTGQTWQVFNDGLLMRDIIALSISADGQYLYAASEGGGVFRASLHE